MITDAAKRAKQRLIRYQSPGQAEAWYASETDRQLRAYGALGYDGEKLQTRMERELHSARETEIGVELAEIVKRELDAGRTAKHEDLRPEAVDRAAARCPILFDVAGDLRQIRARVREHDRRAAEAARTIDRGLVENGLAFELAREAGGEVSLRTLRTLADLHVRELQALDGAEWQAKLVAKWAAARTKPRTSLAHFAAARLAVANAPEVQRSPRGGAR